MSSANNSASALKEISFRRTPPNKNGFDFAYENRNAGCFNDAIINVKRQTIPANKLNLVDFSKYFESMFTTEVSKNIKMKLKSKIRIPWQ